MTHPASAIDLAGRVAVVTGGSGGLRPAIVARLQRSGARASDECSFSTGAVFDLSGGRASW
jgi:NAD(P)-dependent dehydrogenase (short-subunit alcohol dehydrogenase family)